MAWHDALSAKVAKIVLLWFTFVQIFLKPAESRQHNVPGAPHIEALRLETEDLFFHGYDNYMKHAFPEDEVRPISCSLGLSLNAFSCS